MGDDEPHGIAYAGNGLKLLVEGAPVLGCPARLPACRQRPAEVRDDLGDRVGLRPAEEPFDHLVARDLPPDLGKRPDVDLDGEPLGVHEHAVAVEDDEVVVGHDATVAQPWSPPRPGSWRAT